jgi:hypothetical protein
LLGHTQTGSKTHFKQSGNNQNDPVHASAIRAQKNYIRAKQH